MRIGRYSLVLQSLKEGQTDNYWWAKSLLTVEKNGRAVGILEPERRLYLADNQPATEVAVRRRLDEDLYVSFTGASDDGKKVVLHAYIFPLVSWIWVGYFVVLAGTLVCLVPNRSRRTAVRMEVVNVAAEPLQVQS
jgi:cytochrome c-type biogenesis protein CcmF